MVRVSLGTKLTPILKTGIPPRKMPVIENGIRNATRIISQPVEAELCSGQIQNGSRIILRQTRIGPKADTRCECAVQGQMIRINVNTLDIIYSINSKLRKEYVITAADNHDTTAMYNTLIINTTAGDAVNIIWRQRLPGTSIPNQLFLDIHNGGKAGLLIINCSQPSAVEEDSISQESSALWLALTARPVVIVVASVFTLSIVFLILVTITVVAVALRSNTKHRDSAVTMRNKNLTRRISTMYDAIIGFKKGQS
ncbi:hypothetical protein ScPMuIL_012311 [Solemya velum]